MGKYRLHTPVLVDRETVEAVKNKLKVGDRIRVSVITYTDEGLRVEKKMWVRVVRKYRFLAEVRPEKAGKRLPVMTVDYRDLTIQRVKEVQKKGKEHEEN